MDIYVGWQKIKDENHENYGKIELYTTFPHAVDILAKKAEFYYRKEHECMVAVVNKIPRDRKITYYEEFAVNKPANKRVRTAIANDCSKLHELDKEFNKIKDEWLKRVEAFEKKESDIKRRMFMRLLDHGQTVKRGRWFHRVLFIDWFRRFSHSSFPRPLLVLDIDVIRGLARKFKNWAGKLESTIKLQSVEIDPELYLSKVKHCLSPADLQQVHEHYKVEERLLEDLVPELPYEISHKLWMMRSPVDEEGNPIYTIHPQTHQCKNPECQECGGKFVKNTNICKDCGLESHVKTEEGKKSAKTKTPSKKTNKVVWMRPDNGSSYVKKPSKRKRPAAGYSRG